jgi:hypothetical protein
LEPIVISLQDSEIEGNKSYDHNDDDSSDEGGGGGGGGDDNNAPLAAPLVKEAHH